MTTDVAVKSEAEKAAEYTSKIQSEINGYILDRDKAQGQLDSLKGYNVPDDNVAVMAFAAEIADLNGKIERAQGRLASFERGQMTGKFIQPLIDAFGTFAVKDTSAFSGTFSPANLDTIESDLKAEADKLAERIKVFTKFRRDFNKANIPPEIVTEFRPLRFVAVEGESAIKLDVASASRATGTGTRGSRNVERIVSAPDSVYVGKVIGGENPDFANWTALANDAHSRGVISEEEWKSLTTTSTGEKRSVSMRQMLISRYKFQSQIVSAGADNGANPDASDSDADNDGESTETNAD